MPSIAVVRTLLRELCARDIPPRIPEPDLVMEDAAQVAAYVEAGRPEGVMAPVYLFNLAQACSVIRPGDTVVDLACGPANQLALIAELNPQTRFVGVDLSDEMLGRASELVACRQLANVSLRRSDVTDLSSFPDGSVDAVISTMALHHLPTAGHLDQVFRETARILRPSGGTYIVDFGRLKATESILYFARQYADRQPELFTRDYENSLRAAFTRSDFQRAAAALGAVGARLYSTFLAPFLVAVKTPARRDRDIRLAEALRRRTLALPGHHRRDLADLSTFFAAGGLRTPAFV